MIGLNAHRNSADNKNAWMITFADLLSLMLTFFVLLFSMTEVKVEPWRAIVDAFSTSNFPIFVDPVFIEKDDRSITRTDEEKSIDLGYLQAVLADKYTGNPDFSRGSMVRLEDRLVLSLPAQDLFVTGTAEPTEKSRRLATLLAEVIGPVRNQIEIYGHSAPSQEIKGGFLSKWELTLARAAAVAGLLREVGFDRDVSVIGFGDSRFADISARLSDTQRRILAQRIDIVIREP